MMVMMLLAQPERLSGTKYSVLSDIWSFGVSLVEMAIGRFPIPKPNDQDIDEEMKLPAAGSIPPRPKSDGGSIEADKNVPIFAMLVHVVEDVRNNYNKLSHQPFMDNLCLPIKAPPRLPSKYFSADLCNLVEQWWVQLCTFYI